MASKIDETTNIRFLLSCIKHCDGRVDIQKVAEEFGLKSGTASMRLARLKQAHGNTTAGSESKKRSAADGAAAPATPSKRSKKKQQVASNSDDNRYAVANSAEGVEDVGGVEDVEDVNEVHANDDVLEHKFKQEMDMNH